MGMPMMDSDAKMLLGVFQRGLYANVVYTSDGTGGLCVGRTLSHCIASVLSIERMRRRPICSSISVKYACVSVSASYFVLMYLSSSTSSMRWLTSSRCSGGTSVARLCHSSALASCVHLSPDSSSRVSILNVALPLIARLFSFADAAELFKAFSVLTRSGA